MVKEIIASNSLSFSKGGKSDSKVKSGMQIDMTGDNYVRLQQTIGTSAEALFLGDIVTPGWISISNQDATNYVTIRSGSGGQDLVKIMPGETQEFRLATTTPYAVANSAPVKVDYLMLEA